jgi:hypothetical protein
LSELSDGSTFVMSFPQLVRFQLPTGQQAEAEVDSLQDDGTWTTFRSAKTGKLTRVKSSLVWSTEEKQTVTLALASDLKQ